MIQLENTVATCGCLNAIRHRT